MLHSIKFFYIYYKSFMMFSFYRRRFYKDRGVNRYVCKLPAIFLYVVVREKIFRIDSISIHIHLYENSYYTIQTHNIKIFISLFIKNNTSHFHTASIQNRNFQITKCLVQIRFRIINLSLIRNWCKRRIATRRQKWNFDDSTKFPREFFRGKSLGKSAPLPASAPRLPPLQSE